MKPHYRVIPKGTPFYSFVMETEITFTDDFLVSIHMKNEDDDKPSYGTLQNTWIGGAVDRPNGEIAINYNKTIELEDRTRKLKI